MRYLRPEYKLRQREKEESREPKVPASQRIAKELGHEVVERHREEVKQELLRDRDFIMEVISRAPEILEKAEAPKIHQPTEGQWVEEAVEEPEEVLGDTVGEDPIYREREENIASGWKINFLLSRNLQGLIQLNLQEHMTLSASNQSYLEGLRIPSLHMEWVT